MTLPFDLYDGDLIGLPASKNHLVFRWQNPDCKILFSICKIGDALSVHLASDKRGLKHLETASKAFIEFCFDMFDWCEMLVGNIERNSIKRLAERCGFYKVATCRDREKNTDIDIYILPKKNNTQEGEKWVL